VPFLRPQLALSALTVSFDAARPACQGPVDGWYNSLVPRAWPAILAVLLILGASSPVSAEHGPVRLYAQQELNSGRNGIDGYIRHGSVVMQRQDLNAVVDFLSLVDPSPFNWIQIGHLQGTAGMCATGGPCIRNTPRQMISENLVNKQPEAGPFYYYLVPLGAPPAANGGNYAYYAFWNGANCAFCTYNIRLGTYDSQNVTYGFLWQTWGVPQAGYESRWDEHLSGREPLTNDYFGLDHNLQVNTSFGLHLYVLATNTWQLWTDAKTTCVDLARAGAGELVFIPVRTWYAAQVRDDSNTPACD
jgi:hypothetical protein